jgi:dTDP-6-deoxy-L-talose 4-dehydrogenase (NAD+)
LGVKHRIIDASFLGDISKGFSANVDTDMAMPTIKDVLGDARPKTYVPNRNMILMSIAAAFAEVNGVDTIIHLAWYVQPGKYLDSHQNIDCLIGSLNLAKGAAIAGVRRFVGIGTCFEYDQSEVALTVETTIKPVTPYASAKAALYIALSSWLTRHSIEFSWCRLFYLFGEGEHEHRLAPYVRRQLQNGENVKLTSGKQVRDYMDVSLAGSRIGEIALGVQTGPVNICSGSPITVREFVESIAREYGGRHLLKFGVMPDRENDPPFVVGVP